MQRLNSKKATIAINYAQLLPPPTRNPVSLSPATMAHGNNLIMADIMCRRQLRFTKSSTCGHLTFNGQTIIDCRSEECHLSTSAHVGNCTSQCRRYYEMPERLTTKEVGIGFYPSVLNLIEQKITGT